MGIDTKTAIKIFLPWQDENEEKWLEEMAAKGWMVESVIPFFYRFRKCQPNPIAIRLDYKSTWDKDYQEYLTTFNDANWNLITKMGNWHYFSINPQNNTVPEIYNSNRTKALKYRRLLIGLAPFLLLLASPLAHVFDFNYQTSFDTLDIVLRLVYLFASLLFIFSFLRVCIKLIQLKTKHQE